VEASPFLVQADWFECDLQADTWGTIISHMAFSNHFLFHHRYKHGHPEEYARQYMKLLAALKPGGAFYYSPGLPFIESFLPTSQYSITRLELNLEQPDFGSLLEEDVWYVSKIIKLKRE
jgi:hypothetical protein